MLKHANFHIAFDIEAEAAILVRGYHIDLRLQANMSTEGQYRSWSVNIEGNIKISILLYLCNIYFIETKKQSEITQWHCAFNSSHNKNPTRSLRKACLKIGPLFTIVFTRLHTNG